MLGEAIPDTAVLVGVLRIHVLPPGGKSSPGTASRCTGPTGRTADLGVLVSGALRLVMGNGDTVSVAAGDVFVQVRGEHRWSNPTSEPAVLFIVHVPAAGPPR